MTIRCSTDPFGGFNPLIDKTIGNSFRLVSMLRTIVKIFDSHENGRCISCSEHEEY